MFHQQGHCGHLSVAHYLIIIDGGRINQRKAVRIHFFGFFRITETVKPVSGERLQALAAVVKRYRHYQQQIFMARFKMTLHSDNNISQLVKGHIFIRRTLVFQQQMNVPVIAGGGFYAP